MKSNRKQARSIVDKAAHLLQLIETKASFDKQIKDAKAALSAEIEPYQDQFSEGAWVLFDPETKQRVCMVKEVKNAARLVKTDSVQSLTEAEEIKLLEKLPERYRLLSINTTLLNKEQDDKKLVAILQRAGVSVEQTTRYDYKP